MKQQKIFQNVLYILIFAISYAQINASMADVGISAATGGIVAKFDNEHGNNKHVAIGSIAGGVFGLWSAALAYQATHKLAQWIYQADLNAGNLAHGVLQGRINEFMRKYESIGQKLGSMALGAIGSYIGIEYYNNWKEHIIGWRLLFTNNCEPLPDYVMNGHQINKYKFNQYKFKLMSKIILDLILVITGIITINSAKMH